MKGAVVLAPPVLCGFISAASSPALVPRQGWKKPCYRGTGKSVIQHPEKG